MSLRFSEEFAVIARAPSRPATARSPTAAPRKRTPKAAAKPANTEALPAMPGTPRKKATIAGPRGKKAAAKISLPELDRMQAVIVESLDEDKAEDIIAIDLAGRASFADRMVIATGLADRQISAMATHLNEKLVQAGFKKTRAEGAGGTDWVLIDAGDIIVHLFKPDARILYGLEKMWGPDLDEVEPSEP